MLISFAQISRVRSPLCAIFGNTAVERLLYAEPRFRESDAKRTRAMNFLLRFFTNVSRLPPHPILSHSFILYTDTPRTSIFAYKDQRAFGPGAKLLNKGVAFACIVHSSNNSTRLAWFIRFTYIHLLDLRIVSANSAKEHCLLIKLGRDHQHWLNLLLPKEFL